MFWNSFWKALKCLCSLGCLFMHFCLSFLTSCDLLYGRLRFPHGFQIDIIISISQVTTEQFKYLFHILGIENLFATHSSPAEIRRPPLVSSYMVWTWFLGCLVLQTWTHKGGGTFQKRRVVMGLMSVPNSSVLPCPAPECYLAPRVLSVNICLVEWLLTECTGKDI